MRSDIRFLYAGFIQKCRHSIIVVSNKDIVTIGIGVNKSVVEFLSQFLPTYVNIRILYRNNVTTNQTFLV